MSTFACFGLSFLGQCSYDPATPISYFTLGDAVAAVAVTTGIEQFMKPIFVLRLRSQFMSLRRIYALIFFGVACVIVAAIVPSLSALHGLPFGYAIDWEILATIAFVIAYGSIASAIVWPVRVRPGGMRAFANEVATYLCFGVQF